MNSEQLKEITQLVIDDKGVFDFMREHIRMLGLGVTFDTVYAMYIERPNYHFPKSAIQEMVYHMHTNLGFIYIEFIAHKTKTNPTDNGESKI